MNAQFKKGVLELIVLLSVTKRDMYGYELVQTMEKVSGGRFILQEGTLYPILYRLVDQGLIESERVMVGRRMSRVYYQITPKGVEYLAKIRQEYEDITAGVAALLDYRPPEP